MWCGFGAQQPSRAQLPWRFAPIVKLPRGGLRLRPRRGWAWTRALLSLQAPEIHLCGDPSSVELVNRLAAVTGDTVEVMRYDRLAPLRVATAPLRGVRDIEPGDCVVAFGRKALYSLKEQIERSTGLTCGVIYGSLPPAVRRQQAKAFNSREGGLDVLVGESLAVRRCKPASHRPLGRSRQARPFAPASSRASR